MSNAPLRYWIDVAGRTFSVREIAGEERMNTPFRLEARFVISSGPSIEPHEVLRQEATVRLAREGHVRSIEGIITDASIGASKRGAPEVCLVIEPLLSLARYRADIRVFRKKTAPEIVCEVLALFGVSPELRLAEAYERREYCVQFRETDLDFVHRLLEDEGIFYFFLESGTMVLADRAAAYEPISGDPVVPFRAGGGMDRHGDAIVSMGTRGALTASKVSLRDFNPDKPSLDMDVSAETGSPSGAEWYDFPGEYRDPGVGAKKAALHAEAFARAAAGYRGRSLSGRLYPGARFTLAAAPVGVDEGGYAVTAVRHAWAQDKDGFTLEFEADRADNAHRPARKTDAPTLLNPVTGFVTGPAGEDIYTDEWARVKVHFHWDRRQPMDGECSYWIPVLQDNTGHSCAIPRIGWEVLVHFLEGDPDRPVVLGRVYNATDEFPEVLPRNKTRSALKSLSSPGRKGQNQIRFEDLAGAQEINVRAERDQNVVVVHDKTERVELNEIRMVKRDEGVTIGNDHTEKIGGKHAMAVGANQALTVGADRKRTVGTADASSVIGDRSLTIGGSHHLRLKETESTAAKILKEKVGAVILEASLKENGTDAGMAAALTVGGAIAEIAKSEKSEQAGLARVETVGGILFSKSDVDTSARVTKKRRTTVGGLYKITSKKQMSIVGVKKLSAKSLTGEFKADTQLTLKVGETVLSMKDGLITITAKSKVLLTVTGEGRLGADKSTQI